jgi:hypothetical protein
MKLETCYINLEHFPGDSDLVPKLDIRSRMNLPKRLCFDMTITGVFTSFSMFQVKK